MVERIEGDLRIKEVYPIIEAWGACSDALRYLRRLGDDTECYGAWRSAKQDYRDWVWGVLPHRKELQIPDAIRAIREAAHRDFDAQYGAAMDVWAKQHQSYLSTFEGEELALKLREISEARISRHEELTERRERELERYERAVDEWMQSKEMYTALLAHFKTLL